jgi:hypothetical protein
MLGFTPVTLQNFILYWLSWGSDGKPLSHLTKLQAHNPSSC